VNTVLSNFALSAPAVSCAPLGGGLVNRSFLVTCADGTRCVLQRVSRAAFPDPAGLMRNFAAVTRALAAQEPDPRRCLRLIPTRGGRDWYADGEGEAWRMMNYVENSVCPERTGSPADLAACGEAYGRFLHALRDFPADTLCEPIPRFHDTPDRFRLLREAAEADVCRRAGAVREELAFALEREAEAGRLVRLRDAGFLPVRVTHNDTKCANVLLDAATRRPLCVVDLDTVMPGLTAWDFGDAIRSGAGRSGRLELPLCRAFAHGYLSACGALTEAELRSLPQGVWTMALECGIRFLTDFINGDKYFHITYETQNLDRARMQLALVRDAERRWDALSGAILDADG